MSQKWGVWMRETINGQHVSQWTVKNIESDRRIQTVDRVYESVDDATVFRDEMQTKYPTVDYEVRPYTSDDTSTPPKTATTPTDVPYSSLLDVQRLARIEFKRRMWKEALALSEPTHSDARMEEILNVMWYGRDGKPSPKAAERKACEEWAADFVATGKRLGFA